VIKSSGSGLEDLFFYNKHISCLFIHIDYGTLWFNLITGAPFIGIFGWWVELDGRAFFRLIIKRVFFDDFLSFNQDLDCVFHPTLIHVKKIIVRFFNYIWLVLNHLSIPWFHKMLLSEAKGLVWTIAFSDMWLWKQFFDLIAKRHIANFLIRIVVAGNLCTSRFFFAFRKVRRRVEYFANIFRLT